MLFRNICNHIQSVERLPVVIVTWLRDGEHVVTVGECVVKRVTTGNPPCVMGIDGQADICAL